MAKLIVRSIIQNLENNLSRVTLDKANFALVQSSSFAKSSNAYARRFPEAKPGYVNLPVALQSDKVVSADGKWFDLYTIDGVKVFYRYLKKEEAQDGFRHFCAIATDEANKRFEAFVPEAAPVNMLSNVGGFVTPRVAVA